MPRPSMLAQPALGDPDRKRVLNVLAQRRYRQRKKEKYAALESKAHSAGTASVTSSSPESSSEHSSSTEQSFVSADTGVALTTGQVDALDLDPGLHPNFDFDLDGQLDLQLAGLDGPMFDLTNIFPQNLHMYQADIQPVLPLDDGVLEMPVLKLMPLIFEFARNLGSESILFDTNAKWILDKMEYPNLPANMQPTRAQLTIPHHPFFDLLPWPSLRNKLIACFALPTEARPPICRDATALTQIAFDIDDETDGFRVNGGGFNRDDWEVGQAFFRNWWWTLDRSIVDRSNAWRVSRGMAKLSLEAA